MRAEGMKFPSILRSEKAIAEKDADKRGTNH